MVLYEPLPVKLKLFTKRESNAFVLAPIFPVEGKDKVPPTVTVSAPLQPKLS